MYLKKLKNYKIMLSTNWYRPDQPYLWTYTAAEDIKWARLHQDEFIVSDQKLL